MREEGESGGGGIEEGAGVATSLQGGRGRGRGK